MFYRQIMVFYSTFLVILQHCRRQSFRWLKLRHYRLLYHITTMFRIPVITRNLLIINILAFMAMLVFRQMGIADLNSLCGLHFFMAQDFHVYHSSLICSCMAAGSISFSTCLCFGCLVPSWKGCGALSGLFFITFSVALVPV